MNLRKYKDSRRFQCINGVVVEVFNDLDRHELQERYTYAFKREDYEYCLGLIREANRRKIVLKNPE